MASPTFLSLMGPDAARGFNAFSALHGDEQAKQIMSSEAVVLDK